MDLIQATADLRDALDRLPLPRGITHVYNPLRYAWAPHVRYLERFVGPQPSTAPHAPAARRRVVLVGMNPGPHGMAQTGVPFGDVPHALEILGESMQVGQPTRSHPCRPVEGFACKRIEDSGDRLWGALKDAWRPALLRAPWAKLRSALDPVLADVFAVNFCPLVFWDSDGKNITPDKLAQPNRDALRAVCAPYLAAVIRAMQPEVVVCVGRFAERETLDILAEQYLDPKRPRCAYLLHPSPRACTADQFTREAARVLAPYAPKAAP